MSLRSKLRIICYILHTHHRLTFGFRDLLDFDWSLTQVFIVTQVSYKATLNLCLFLCDNTQLKSVNKLMLD